MLVAPMSITAAARGTPRSMANSEFDGEVDISSLEGVRSVVSAQYHTAPQSHAYSPICGFSRQSTGKIDQGEGWRSGDG